MNMFIDSHMHFDHFVATKKLENIIENARKDGVEKMISIGGSHQSNELSIKLAKDYQKVIYATAGYDRELASESYDAESLIKQVSLPIVKAVGETGLDYFHSQENKKEQIKLFQLNLDLACRFNKPVIVHSRASNKDTLSMLQEYVNNITDYPGVLHCFTLDLHCAKKLLDLGMMISFSGIVTFNNAEELRNVVPYIPDEQLLIETDAPYLAPVPKRGKENEPGFIKYTAMELAKIRGCSIEYLSDITTKNAKRLFRLD